MKKRMSTEIVNLEKEDVDKISCTCGCELFDTSFKLAVLSSLHPKNPEKEDMIVPEQVFVCRKCGEILDTDKDNIKKLKLDAMKKK